MPLITPKTDWIAGDSVGFSDMNRIEGNILYLQNENKTINGTNIFTGASTFNSPVTIDTGTTNTALKLISTDIYVSLTMEDNTTTIPDAILRGGNNLLLLPSGGNASIGSLANPNADKLYVNGTVNIDSIASFGSSLISLKQSTSLASGLGASSGNDMQIIRGGSDSSFLGANLRFYDPSTPSLTFTQQLSASGHYDLWLYNGTVWNRQYRATREGRHLFGNGLVDNTIDTVQIGGTLNINNIANFGSSEISMLELLSIDVGTANTALSLVSTDTYVAIAMEDNTTTIPDAILRGGNNLLLVPNGGNTSIGSLSNPDGDKLYVNGSVRIDGGVKTDNVTLKTKVLNIGAWNMSSGGGGSTSKSVTHGLTRSKIRKAQVVIENDSGTTTYPLEYVPFNELSSTTAIPEGSLNVTATDVVMRIRSGGWWNAGTNTEFDGTQNRGYIEIEYEA